MMADKAHRDTPHPCRFGGLDTSDGVLEDDAMESGSSQLGGCNLKHLRIRFSALGLLGCYQRLEQLTGLRQLKHEFQIGSRRARRNSLPPARSMEIVQELSCPRQQRDAYSLCRAAVDDFLSFSQF